MSDDLTSPANLARVALEKHLIETRSNTLKLRIARGELVKRSAAEAAHYAIGIRIRDTLLTASSRHAAILAAKYGVNAAELAAALDEIVRNALIALADGAESDELSTESANSA